jgi:hypothetical protein
MHVYGRCTTNDTTAKNTQIDYIKFEGLRN